MKKLRISSAWLRIRILQILLALLCFDAYDKTFTLGDNTFSEQGDVHEIVDEGFRKIGVPKAISTESGYVGGSLAMGMIVCTSLFLIVWLELSYHKNKIQEKGDQLLH